MKKDDFARSFADPGQAYRSLPFFSLNGRLVPEELARQMKDMIQKGMGGGFMHSRTGLETRYMSDGWMTALESVIKAASDAGGCAWLYDEDRFPSGGAGGLVQSRDRLAFSAKAVTLDVDGDPTGGDILLRVAFTTGENNLAGYRKLSPGETAQSGEHVAVFRCEVSAPCMWFNNEAPSDNMNPDAVSEFIRVTHEKYKERFGQYFGTVVPGIFTDEPSINDFRVSYTPGRPYLPWTTGFDAYFSEKRGYDVIEKLPYLFMEGEESFKVRHDYWHTVTERFTEAWSKQIGEWCEKNGLCYTGHYMSEHALGSSVRMSGAVMPHYMYQGMPGIDMLTGDAREYLTAKQMSSVANQLGRRSICEMYGCSGWDYSFEGQRVTGDWLYVMGIDTRCQHHALYTLKGSAKRDYPPSFNYNSVWWEHNRVTEDYFARLGMALSGGRAVRNVLILHPQSSAWGYTGAGSCVNFAWHVDDTASDALQAKLETLMKRLLAEHIDFDFGDEMTMEKLGKVTGEGIRIGRMTYPVVILPWLETVLPATKSLLEEFVRGGGRVIALGRLPARVDGRPEAAYLSEDAIVCRDIPSCIKELNTYLGDRLHITDDLGREADVLALFKESDEGRTLFVVNENGPKRLTVTLPEKYAGYTVRCDALTGRLTDVRTNGNCFSFNLGDRDSALFRIVGDPADLGRAEVFPEDTVVPDLMRMRRLSFGATVKRSHPNVLPLDKPAWQLGDGELHGADYVFNIQKPIREQLGMPVSGETKTQRYLWMDKKYEKDGTPLRLIYEFEVDAVPEGTVRVAAEDVGSFRITLNGETCPAQKDGYYIDKCIGTVPLLPLKRGKNRLVLTCGYFNTTQLEDIYLIGDFGVSPERVIIAEPETVYPGNWCACGYYHYAGALTYSYPYRYSGEGNRRLYIGEYKGVTAGVTVNGWYVADIPWKGADGVDITPYLKPGDNVVSVEIMGSQRNAMGLFHKTGCQNEWVDWTFFTRDDARSADDYDVVPCGLMSVPRVLED